VPKVSGPLRVKTDGFQRRKSIQLFRPWFMIAPVKPGRCHPTWPLYVMPLFESESLVLRSYNLAEADRIVVFFTRNHGIVRGVAKGAKRLKSRFGSTLELFSTVHLTYFQKEDRELVSVQNVDLTLSRFDVASNPEFLHTFSYLAELLTAMLPPHDPSETTYRMTKACLDAKLDGPDKLAAVRLYFELWLLRLGGYLPDWSKCGECSRRLMPDEPAGLRHDLHLVCEKCQRSRRLPAVLPLQRDLFQRVQSLAPVVFIEHARPYPDAVNELSEVLRRIITQVLGRELMNERSLAVNS
jgi:DNA repair protein RecO (recombination protein O)